DVEHGQRQAKLGVAHAIFGAHEREQRRENEDVIMRDEMRRADDADDARRAGPRRAEDGLAHLRASWMACQARAGVIGISRWRMQYRESASITAFATQGRPPEVPASPQPFAPTGLVFVGTG